MHRIILFVTLLTLAAGCVTKYPSVRYAPEPAFTVEQIVIEQPTKK